MTAIPMGARPSPVAVIDVIGRGTIVEIEAEEAMVVVMMVVVMVMILGKLKFGRGLGSQSCIISLQLRDSIGNWVE